MAYGLSNGHVIDDVTWPPKVPWSSTVGYPSDSLASCFWCVHRISLLVLTMDGSWMVTSWGFNGILSTQVMLRCQPLNQTISVSSAGDLVRNGLLIILCFLQQRSNALGFEDVINGVLWMFYYEKEVESAPL